MGHPPAVAHLNGEIGRNEARPEQELDPTDALLLDLTISSARGGAVDSADQAANGTKLLDLNE